MVVAKTALQGEALQRPLILREEGAHRRTGVVEVWVRVLGNRIRPAGNERPVSPTSAATERVGQALVVGVLPAVILPPVALVAELHAVRTGDERAAHEPVGAVGLVDQPVLRPVR